MTYRSERDALRQRLESLEQELADARTRAGAADELSRDLAQKQREIEQLRAELAQYHPIRFEGAGAPGGKEAGGQHRAPRRMSAPLILAVALSVGGVALALYSADKPPNAVQPGPLSASAHAPTPPPVPTESPSTAEKVREQKEEEPIFGREREAILAADMDRGPGFLAVTLEDSLPASGAYVTAFAMDGTRLWRAGPYAGRTGSLRVRLAGERAVVVDGLGQGHIVGMRTGAETGAFRLTDAARQLCVDGNTVWIDTVDRKSAAIDVMTAKALHTGRPPSCAALEEEALALCRGAAAVCTSGSAAPPVPGIHVVAVVREGTNAVAFGRKSPGTATTMAYGFDTSTRAVRWRTVVPADQSTEDINEYPGLRADLANGIFVAVYDTDAGNSRLTALDAKTGARLWDVAVTQAPPPADTVVASRTRAYVMYWGRLHVFDIATGRRIMSLGR